MCLSFDGGDGPGGEGGVSWDFSPAGIAKGVVSLAGNAAVPGLGSAAVYGGQGALSAARGDGFFGNKGADTVETPAFLNPTPDDLAIGAGLGATDADLAAAADPNAVDVPDFLIKEAENNRRGAPPPSFLNPTPDDLAIGAGLGATDADLAAAADPNAVDVPDFLIEEAKNNRRGAPPPFLVEEAKNNRNGLPAPFLVEEARRDAAARAGTIEVPDFNAPGRPIVPFQPPPGARGAATPEEPTPEAPTPEAPTPSSVGGSTAVSAGANTAVDTAVNQAISFGGSVGGGGGSGKAVKTFGAGGRNARIVR